MEYKDLEILVDIYNSLLLINTKGEDTVRMGQTLLALHTFILKSKEEVERKLEVTSSQTLVEQEV